MQISTISSSNNSNNTALLSHRHIITYNTLHNLLPHLSTSNVRIPTIINLTVPLQMIWALKVPTFPHSLTPAAIPWFEKILTLAPEPLQTPVVSAKLQAHALGLPGLAFLVLLLTSTPLSLNLVPLCLLKPFSFRALLLLPSHGVTLFLVPVLVLLLHLFLNLILL